MIGPIRPGINQLERTELSRDNFVIDSAPYIPVSLMKVDLKEKLQYLTENQESVVEKMGSLKLLVNSVKEEVNMTNLNWANNLDRINDQSFEMEKLRNSLLRIQESQNELNKKDQKLNDSIPKQNVTEN